MASRFDEIYAGNQKLHVEKQTDEVEMPLVPVETQNSQLATRNLPVEPLTRSTTPSESACPTAAERFQNPTSPIYFNKTQYLYIPTYSAEPRHRSGWSNKTGSVSQLPGLLWEPTPERPKRLLEHSKATITLPLLPALSREPTPEQLKRL